MSYSEMVNYKNDHGVGPITAKFGKLVKYEDALPVMGDRAAKDAAYSGLCSTCGNAFYCSRKSCGCYSCTHWDLSTDYDD